jgi:hypothetical protein
MVESDNIALMSRLIKSRSSVDFNKLEQDFKKRKEY